MSGFQFIKGQEVLLVRNEVEEPSTITKVYLNGGLKEYNLALADGSTLFGVSEHELQA